MSTRLRYSTEELMGLALVEARRGIRGANPLVGAVIASPSGQLLASGFHRGAGTAHAEVAALAQAGERGIDVRGAHLVVTLEPCNHSGRTGPCSQAVVESGIARLTYALSEITETASGGAAYLRSQGIQVESGVCAEKVAELNRRWFRAVMEHRPWVSAKIASTIDGLVAAVDGSSQWITGQRARDDGHDIRARSDAVLVGTETVFTDNPRLTSRNSAGSLGSSQPLRVVMGKRPLIPGAALTADANWLQVKSHNPRVVLTKLYSRGVRHLLVEGGPTVVSAFVRERLVDELFWYQAPCLLGAGRRGVEDLGITTLVRRRQFTFDDLGMCPEIARFGDDLRLHLLARNY